MRGVSTLVTKALPISIHAVRTDIKGRYVILVIKVMNRLLTIVNIYVPPPFSVAHLDDMIQATYEIAEGKIFILGDFNSVSVPSLDRLGAAADTPTPLVGWMSTQGLRDVWCFHYSDTREYSCYLEMHKTLSRIDNILSEGE